MEITWVNHASFVTSVGPVRLICDPWLEGTVFNHSWALLSPTKFEYEDFSNITHIFFSHEHPDHFYPPNLRNIPESFRRNITVLFHETLDKRVLNLCKSWGFNTLELRNKKWLEIANEIHILCGRQDLIDSWLVIKGGGQTLVNLNDCVFGSSAELREIKNVVGQPDVLLTQFSYANWVGNPDDADSHRKEARCKLAEMQRQAEILQPKALIPCASFVWFCHEENYFMNRQANRIDTVYDFLHSKCGVNTIVLYPGDCWTVGQAIDSTVALRRYEKDYDAVENEPLLVKAEPVPFEKLCQAQASFSRKVFSKNNRFLIQAIPDSVALLSDLGIKVRISFRSGITKVTNQAVLPDIIVSSESLQYCYLYGWGGNTLEVNGRYSVVPAGKPKRFFNHFKVGSYNDSGFVFNSRLLLDIAKRKLARLARLPGAVPRQ